MASLVELAFPEIEYPEADGQPIGETDFHITATLLLLQMLRDHFENNPQVYVASDLMFYYEPGNPRAVKAPDILVVKGVGKHKRRVYKLWEESAIPCTIFEITSKQTAQADLTVKYQLYERLGVKEYFLFDPLDEYLQPRLQGFILVQGRYQALPLSAEDELVSRELGLILRPQRDLLRLVDSYTGQRLATSHESVRRAELAEQQAHVETQRANVAEAKIIELQQELERLRWKKN
ncbi:MAG: Uma2 family endonuclease [Thioploca sp.]|nr:Uma2 family endonuclease [Thioploca sp.]